ncbi:hypothetical protein F1880_007762 [Penicillium rolfsii]|nr:hypothetical protein F1880_007762 [Penicillium rolfsii]
MAFDIQFAQPTDAPELAEAFFAAFSNRFNRAMFPDSPGVRAWMQKNLLGSEGIPDDQVILIVTDPSNPNVVAGFAKWVRPSFVSSAEHDRHAEALDEWPEGSDRELCELFFGTMDRDRGEIMKGKPHYFLDLLGVHPSYQGRGLGSKLLRWGLARADEEGVEVYLSGSPDGRPLYERNGFQTVGESFSPYPGYEQVNMVRPVQTR